MLKTMLSGRKIKSALVFIPLVTIVGLVFLFSPNFVNKAFALCEGQYKCDELTYGVLDSNCTGSFNTESSFCSDTDQSRGCWRGWDTGWWILNRKRVCEFISGSAPTPVPPLPACPGACYGSGMCPSNYPFLDENYTCSSPSLPFCCLPAKYSISNGECVLDRNGFFSTLVACQAALSGTPTPTPTPRPTATPTPTPIPGCKAIGETCVNNPECCSNTCRLDPADNTRACVAAPTPTPIPGCKAIGETCVNNPECCSNTCRLDPADNTRACVAAPTPTPGGPTATPGGPTSPPLPTTPPPPAGYNAACVSNTLPTTVNPGQSFTATIKMKNTGTGYWAGGGANPDGISSVPFGSAVWGSSGVALPAGTIINQNQEAEFTLNLTAPGAGTYDSFWKMVHIGALFGAQCGKNITVVDACPWDIIKTGDSNGRVDAADLVEMNRCYSPLGSVANCGAANLGGTSVVNALDYSILLTHWGNCN